MFQRILVPLDGSACALQALPVAVKIAKQAGSELHLLRVMPLPTDYLSTWRYTSLREDMLHEEQEQAKAYLEAVASSPPVGPAGLVTHTAVLLGEAVEGIHAYAAEQQMDLIVLSSHGYSGIKRWALGSVAQKLVRHSAIPVLVLRADGAPLVPPESEKTHPISALVALDGSSFAETILPPALHVVSLLNAPAEQGELHLVRIVKPPTDREELLYQPYDVDIADLALSEANDYLKNTCSRLNADATLLNLRVTTEVLKEQDIATTLLNKVDPELAPPAFQTYDMLALTTHGRGGIARWVAGSIAERLLQKNVRSVLVVRPQEA